MIAGIGCRRGVSATEVLAAIDAALAAYARKREDLSALATLPMKQDEDGIVGAAASIGCALRLVSLADRPTLTRSEASRAATGSGSASEAAALAAAGTGSSLLGPRIATGSVTCALAIEARP